MTYTRILIQQLIWMNEARICSTRRVIHCTRMPLITRPVIIGTQLPRNPTAIMINSLASLAFFFILHCLSRFSAEFSPRKRFFILLRTMNISCIIRNIMAARMLMIITNWNIACKKKFNPRFFVKIVNGNKNCLLEDNYSPVAYNVDPWAAECHTCATRNDDVTYRKIVLS